jgi:hypothetical protein
MNRKTETRTCSGLFERQLLLSLTPAITYRYMENKKELFKQMS